jgi:O-antigen biosynthesis protein
LQDFSIEKKLPTGRPADRDAAWSWTLRLRLSGINALRRVKASVPSGWIAAGRRCFSGISAFLPSSLRYRLYHLVDSMRHTDGDIERDYSAWIELYDRIDADTRGGIMEHIARMPDPPVISILMPVFNPSPVHLSAAIKSLRNQFYPQWELCLGVDASTDPSVVNILRDAAAQDRRIKLVRCGPNDTISAPCNSALRQATGPFVALLDQKGLLPPHALYEVAAKIEAQPDADVIYSDEDQIDGAGLRFNPFFKPDWNPEQMLGQNLIGHFGVFRRSLVERIGDLRIEDREAYSLALRVVVQTKPDRILHIPCILYHSQQPGRTRWSPEDGRTDHVSDGSSAVLALLAADFPGVRVEPASVPTWNRVIYPIPRPEPLISVIIPTRNHADLLARTVDGLLARTDYSTLEVVIVDNGSDEPECVTLLAQLTRDERIRVLPCPGPFNYSALNNRAVRESAGELILLLNNDIDVIDPGWLREMVSHAIRPGIGAVGAKLLYPDGTIQHGGVTVGMGGVAGHQYLHKPSDHIGYFGQLAIARNVSAVTGACLLLRRQAFLEVGGLDEVSLPVAFNDIDLCLKLIQRGYRNLWTPYAELYHYESASRGPDLVGEKAARFRREIAIMRERWGEVLDHDPYLNPNLSLHSTEVALAFPPRIRRTGAPPRAREKTGAAGYDARALRDSGDSAAGRCDG